MEMVGKERVLSFVSYQAQLKDVGKIPACPIFPESHPGSEYPEESRGTQMTAHLFIGLFKDHARTSVVEVKARNENHKEIQNFHNDQFCILNNQ